MGLLFSVVMCGTLPAAAEAYYKFGPSGGGLADKSLKPFDASAPAGNRISEVQVWEDKYIEAIQLIYESGQSKKYGGSGGKLLKSLKLDLTQDECIQTVKGRYGDVVDSLIIRTNIGRTVIWGGPKGSADYVYTVKPGDSIQGFFGFYKDHINAIGVQVQPGDQSKK
jgi:hypothetical protein